LIVLHNTRKTQNVSRLYQIYTKALLVYVC